jgi:uncharacterized membrane protein (TIGR01666 family)
MRHKASAIPYFFFSQSLSDGLRITFSILAPVLFFRHLGYFEMGLALSLGAICVNITDLPGPLIHRRNGLFIASFLIFIASLISGFFHINVILTAAIIVLFTFLFTLFSVYGIRAATIGSASLLVMILSLNNQGTELSNIFLRSVLILAGALWYSCISILTSTMRPYRMAQRSLGECIRETAKFLSLKAEFYIPKTDLETNYRNLIAQQIVVNEKQNELRELLYKTRQIVKDSSGTGRILMLTFVETIDLYEQITASYYNYEGIRIKYNNSGILRRIAFIIKKMSFELNDIGFAIQSNIPYRRNSGLEARIVSLQTYIEASNQIKGEDKILLKKIAGNLENILNHIKILLNYFESGSTAAGTSSRRIEHKSFISRQDYNPEVFLDNLTFKSSSFRHALRVSIACVAAFTVAHILNYGEHSYWILITVVFIMKPAFSLTKKRNIERLIGTAAGGLIGVLILYLFPDPEIDFIFLLILMIGTYTFMRINYVTMVIFTTPYVLIMLKLLGNEYLAVVQERILDTGIGCGIALISGYILFPKWEAEQLSDLLHAVLKANLNYIRSFAGVVFGNQVNLVEYRIARKEVFVSSANLSAAFQRMLSEPRKKQMNIDKVYEFVVLNHILSSNIASLAGHTAADVRKLFTATELELMENIQSKLEECLNPQKTGNISAEQVETRFREDENTGLKGQLRFILHLCNDIYKAEKTIRNTY